MQHGGRIAKNTTQVLILQVVTKARHVCQRDPLVRDPLHNGQKEIVGGNLLQNQEKMCFFIDKAAQVVVHFN